MRFAGGLMVFLGIASFILHFIGTELTMLAWIDTWGPSTAHAIRIGLIVAGSVLLLVAGKRGSASE
jgi:hypothetical protein